MKRTAIVLLCVLAAAVLTLAQGRRGRGEQPPPHGPQGYSIEQAISDRAQLHTIAFDGLAFLTGDDCSNTFIPPGKVSDFFGFQYIRDIDVAEGGHNTSFLTRIANATLALLTDAQRAQLVTLARAQETPIAEFARRRFPLIVAFGRQLRGDVPAGTALSRDGVVKHSADLYELDGSLAFDRARAVGAIVRSLNASQREALARLTFGDSTTWPDLPDQVDKRSLSHGGHVAVMTYASEMFSWYAGSAEADTYFCPERHGMYFGSFYMKDAPAMGQRNYSISTRLTGDSGELFLEALNETQRERITSIPGWQRPTMEEIVRVRREIAIELRRFMAGDSADRAKVIALSRRYGALDGELSYVYATRFAEVARTLTAPQKQQLLALRNLDGYTCRGAYLYSEPIAWPQVGNTDSLFR
jgi:Spy/CpxP family protein refolding chaperone